MTLRVVPTLYGDSVTTHDYEVKFRLFGPEGLALYRLRFRYNARMGRWVLSIFDPTGQTVVMGAPIVHGVNLLRYAEPGLAPRGFLFSAWTGTAPSAPDPTEKTLDFLLYAEREQDLDPEPIVLYPEAV